jgi:uncharacterized protein YlzI (FlbEa/FlbD family)
MPHFVTIIINPSRSGISINPEHVSAVENIPTTTRPGTGGSIVTMSNGTKYEVSEGRERIIQILTDPTYRDTP